MDMAPSMMGMDMNMVLRPATNVAAKDTKGQAEQTKAEAAKTSDTKTGKSQASDANVTASADAPAPVKQEVSEQEAAAS